MASSKLFIILVIVKVAISVPSILATDHVVGGATGWTPNFDYKTWAQGKEFRVGDRLIFNYQQGSHNVIKIRNATSFQQCAVPSDAEISSSGKDVIALATPGKKWYFCGFGQHCKVGNQKLAITVLAEGETLPPAPAPSTVIPPPPSAATGRTVSVYYGLMAIVVAFVGILVL